MPTLVIADELAELSMNADNWVIPAGNYNNERYSKLEKISENNIQNLKLAWSFSIGVLRGHKGNVLVIDETMYVYTPFPNMVFAHDINNNGAIKWKYQPTQSYDETVVQFISILSGVIGWAGIAMIKTPMVLLVLNEHYLVGLIWVGF